MAAINSLPIEGNPDVPPTGGLPSLSSLPKDLRQMDLSSSLSSPLSEIQNGAISPRSGLGMNWSTPYLSTRTRGKENSPYARQTMVVEPSPPVRRGHLVLTLFDSGSDAELISKSFIENAGLMSMITPLSTPESLVGIGGSLMTAKEEITLQWTFSNKSPTLPLRCFVVEIGLGDFDLLLGRGFLFEHKILVLQAPRPFEKEELSVAMLNMMRKRVKPADIKRQVAHQDDQRRKKYEDAAADVQAMLHQHSKPHQTIKNAISASYRRSDETLRPGTYSLDGTTDVPGSEMSEKDTKRNYPIQESDLTRKSVPIKVNMEISEVNVSKSGSVPSQLDSPLKTKAEPAEQHSPKPEDQGSPKPEKQKNSYQVDQNLPTPEDQTLPKPASQIFSNPVDQSLKKGHDLLKPEHESEPGPVSVPIIDSLIDGSALNVTMKSLESDSARPPNVTKPDPNQQRSQAPPDSTVELKIVVPGPLGIKLPVQIPSSTLHKDNRPSGPDTRIKAKKNVGFTEPTQSVSPLSQAETAVEDSPPPPPPQFVPLGRKPVRRQTEPMEGKLKHDEATGATQPGVNKRAGIKKFAALAV
jgi:hypothetical protein